MDTNYSDSRTRFIKTNGVKVAYRKFGTGAPLLFFNRFRGIIDSWDPAFLDPLSESHTIVLFDYPGVGDSQGELPVNLTEVASWGVVLMESLGYEQFFVLGWSYGGLVAQACLFANKDRVREVVLIGTNPPGVNQVPFDKTFFERALKPDNDLEDETVIFFEPSSAQSRHTAKTSFDRIATRLDRSQIPSTPAQLQRYIDGSAWMKSDSEDFRGQYKTLSTPVLVLSADHDISFAVENWLLLLRNAPSMQHIIINDSGHGLQHQHPELVAAYIQTFLS